jgi:hypothetical protein
MRKDRGTRLRSLISGRLGQPYNAQRFTVNLAGDVAIELRQSAEEVRVSESSIVEIALRQLFRSVNPTSLGAFLREHGGCLRRRQTLKTLRGTLR